MSDSLVRPTTRSCASTGSAFHVSRSCTILLHDDVAPAGERRVGVADDHRVVCDPPSGVLGAINETEEVALVEILESVDLVDDGDRCRATGP